MPFASGLQVVTRSRALPTYLVCALGDARSGDDLDTMVAALASMHQQEDGRLVLAETQMKRFRPVDEKAMKRVRDLLATTDGTD